jgi:hypothetical protein
VCLLYSYWWSNVVTEIFKAIHYWQWGLPLHLDPHYSSTFNVATWQLPQGSVLTSLQHLMSALSCHASQSLKAIRIATECENQEEQSNDCLKRSLQWLFRLQQYCYHPVLSRSSPLLSDCQQMWCSMAQHSASKSTSCCNCSTVSLLYHVCYF